MLEKNKDYIEMRVSCTDCIFTPDEAKISIEGYSYGSYWRLPDPGEDYILISKEKFDRLQANVDINSELARQWEINYNLLLKKIGFDTVEELVNYLDSEANCDTLHETISKLHDEVAYTCEKLASANSENNSWKATAECNSPKTLMTKLNLLRGSIKEWKEETGIYKRALKEWKEATGYPNPSSAKTAIESGASWCHAYNEVKEKNQRLTDDVESWKNVTGYPTPECYLSAILNNNIAIRDYKEIIQKWKEATGCSTPKEAKEFIDNKKKRINELNDELDASQSAVDEAHDRTTEMEDQCMEYREQIQSLYKVIKGWREVTGCSTLEEAKNWVNELGEANGNLAQAVLSWQNVTGFKTPEDAKDYWVAKLSESGESNESLAREVRSWREVTGFSTPEKCSSYIDALERKLEDIKDLIEED